MYQESGEESSKSGPVSQSESHMQNFHQIFTVKLYLVLVLLDCQLDNLINMIQSYFLNFATFFILVCSHFINIHFLKL